MILTLGSRGAVFACPSEGPSHVTAPEVANPVDTTGAGDAFVGALAHFMHSGGSDLSLEEAVRRSCVVASHSVRKAGTQQSYPFRKELPNKLFA